MAISQSNMTGDMQKLDSKAKSRKQRSCRISDSRSEQDSSTLQFEGEVVRARMPGVFKSSGSKSHNSLTRSYFELVQSIDQDLDFDEELDLAAASKNGCASSRDRLVLAHLKLVVSIASRYKGQGLPVIDLIQEGNLGLMKALEKFDTSRGIRFGAYASWWIREAITRALSNKSRTVRLPVHLNEFMTKLRRIRSELSIKLGRSPNERELADTLKVSEEKVSKALRSTMPTISLDQPTSGTLSASNAGGEGARNLQLVDILEDSSYRSPEEELDIELLRLRISKMLSTLSEPEKEIIILRFGLGGEEPRSLRDISELTGLTRDQVGKLSSKAMRNLKKLTANMRLEQMLA